MMMATDCFVDDDVGDDGHDAKVVLTRMEGIGTLTGNITHTSTFLPIILGKVSTR